MRFKICIYQVLLDDKIKQGEVGEVYSMHAEFLQEKLKR
jgi:hypothetical protein